MQGASSNLVFKLLIAVVVQLTYTRLSLAQSDDNEVFYSANGTIISIVTYNNEIIDIQGQAPFSTIKYAKGDIPSLKTITVFATVSDTKDLSIADIEYDYFDSEDLCILLKRPEAFYDYTLLYIATRNLFQNAYSCPLEQETYLIHKGFENTFSVIDGHFDVACKKPWYLTLRITKSTNVANDNLFYVVYQMDMNPVLGCK